MSCQAEGIRTCTVLGIRIGFYLQWFGSIVAEWLSKDQALSLRFANSFFIAATFLALIIQTSTGLLSSVDIYIIILLTYGAYYYFIPLYTWRLIIGCSPFWDPSRWPRVPPSRVYSSLTFALLVAVASFQMWFWCTGVNTVPRKVSGCPEYGFFFAMIPLDNAGFIAVNILVNVGMLIACFVHLCLALGLVRQPRNLRRKEKKARKKKISDEREYILQLLYSLTRLAVASTIVAATELTIQWNDLTGINDISTAGQTIPLIIGLSALVRVLYVALVKEDDNGEENNSNEGEDSNGDRPDPRPHRPRPQPIWVVPEAAPVYEVPLAERLPPQDFRRP